MNQQLIDKYVSDMYEAMDTTNTNRKKREQVQARAAIICTLNKVSGTYAISKALNVHRSNITYHSKKHESNLVWWEGYKEKYDICGGVLKRRGGECEFCNGEKEIKRLGSHKSEEKVPCPVCNT